MASAAASIAPVPLAELKDFLRISSSEDDALLAGLTRSASELCEAFTGVTLIARTFEEALGASAAWTRLGRTPVRAILGVSSLSAGVGEPLPVATYATDIDASGDGWIRTSGMRGRVLVRYEAGLAADWNGIPESLRQGVVRMAAHLYVSRDAAGSGEPPAAAAALWRPYRRLRLC